MVKIAICDDDNAICFQIENIILEYDKKSIICDVEVFHSGVELCRFLRREHDFDLIFLDIEMEGKNGIEVGKTIRNDMDNQMTQIVYISAKTSYCMDLFEIRPLNFLEKPLSATAVINEVNKTITLCNKYYRTFSYKNDRSTYKVAVKDILYFESKNKTIRLISADSTDTFYGTLDDIHIKLSDLNFIRIHKSFLVNVHQVQTFHYEKVIMTNGNMLPISQSKRKEIRFMQFNSVEED